MEGWEERVCDEQNELRKRIFKLRRFTDSPQFYSLHESEQKLLTEQLSLMNELFSVLQERINRM